MNSSLRCTPCQTIVGLRVAVFGSIDERVEIIDETVGQINRVIGGPSGKIASATVVPFASFAQTYAGLTKVIPS